MPAGTGDRGGAVVARDYAAHVRPALLPVAATLLALAGVRSGDTVADVSCGGGLLTHAAAAAAGPSGLVVGIDPDAALLAAARDRRPSRVTWVRADAARLPLPGNAVDKLLCGAPPQRPADVRAAAAEWARVLAPGGRVAVSAWRDLAASEPEAAAGAALAANGIDGDPRGEGPGVSGDGDLTALLRGAGLRVTYDATDEVTLPFSGPRTYAAWRLSLPRTAALLADRPDAAAVSAAVVAAVTEAAGDGPVLVGALIRYATATTDG